MTGEIYPRFQPELNVPYLIRLHHSSPLITTGKFGEYYYTHIDVWKPNGTTDSAVNRMLGYYKEGVPPQVHYWTLSESFARMWLAVDLTKNSLFLMVRKAQFSAKHNKEFPYYEIKTIGGINNNKIFSTIDFTDGDIPATKNRMLDDPDSEDIRGYEPNTVKLLKVNPDILTLFSDSINESVLLFKQHNINVSPESIILTAKTLFYETMKKGWTINDRPITGDSTNPIGSDSSDKNINKE